MTQKVVLASSNSGKLREMQDLLTPLGVELALQDTLQVPQVAETGLSFVENALIKARNACEHTGLAAIADDSGIEVDALDGRPGIYSARFAGTTANDLLNNEKLLRELSAVNEPQRGARFVCLIVYIRHATDATPIIAQGLWPGQIARQPQGENGFGYDPLFYLPQQQCTSAQLNAAEKNRLSHRGQALRILLQRLQTAS